MMAGEAGARWRRWATLLAMAVPLAVALFLLFLALATGKALTLAFGWVAIQLFGYLALLGTLGLHPPHPMLTAQIVIHWLGTLFVLFFLFGGAEALA